MSLPDPVTIAVTGGLVLGGANQVAKQAQDFLAAATGHPGESLGTILGNMTHRRIRNAEGMMSRAHFTLLNIGVTAKEIPLKIVHPLLEAASLEEDTRTSGIMGKPARKCRGSPPRECRLSIVHSYG